MPREGKKLMERKVCCAHFGKFRALRREPPRLPLRREVDACIKDLSRQTEGEIHRVYAKAVDITYSKSK